MTERIDFPDNDDGPVERSEWELLLDRYRSERDAFIDYAKQFWLIPSTNNTIRARKANEELSLFFESLAMYMIDKDDDEDDMPLEERMQLIGSIGRVCDEDSVKALNDIIGYEKLKVLYDGDKMIFVSDEDADKDDMRSGVESYVETIQKKLVDNFDTFYDSKVIDVQYRKDKLKGFVFDIAKTSAAVAIGIFMSEKIRNRDTNN